MNIAFDAKRAFHNPRGLGNYSRNTIRVLGTYFPENNYLLFNPKYNHTINFEIPDTATEHLPNSFMGKAFPSLWRSAGMCRQIKQHQVDVYHGLSQELPLGINKTGAAAVVTMHDAIFMRFPELYKSTYRSVFIPKNRYACKTADKIIAVSEQTKRDVMTYFDADEQKIEVVYQGCNNIFREKISCDTKTNIELKYNLPKHFMLFVGAIESRKNIAIIMEAMRSKQVYQPLVIIGNQTEYKQELMHRIDKYGLTNRVFFLHHVQTHELPAIYALSKVFIYPSIFEGFGIPVLEALCVGTPVITAKGSCLEEAGGPYSKYFDPYNAEELVEHIQRIDNDVETRNQMITQGLLYADNFSDEKIATKLMQVYTNI